METISFRPFRPFKPFGPVDNGDEFTYAENSLLEMAELDEPLDHTDRNTLTRVQTYDLPPPG